MYCNKCGKKYEEKDSFCTECGAPVAGKIVTQDPAEPEKAENVEKADSVNSESGQTPPSEPVGEKKTSDFPPPLWKLPDSQNPGIPFNAPVQEYGKYCSKCKEDVSDNQTGVCHKCATPISQSLPAYSQPTTPPYGQQTPPYDQQTYNTPPSYGQQTYNTPPNTNYGNYNFPGGAGYNAPNAQAKISVGNLVFAILNLVVGACCIVGAIIAIPALILSIAAKSNRHLKTVALILNIIAALITVIMIISQYETFMAAYEEALNGFTAFIRLFS